METREMYQRAKRLSQLALGPVLLLLSLVTTSAWAEEALPWLRHDHFAISPGVRDVGHPIFGLYMMVFWLCVVIGIGVLAVMIYPIFAFRRSAGRKSSQFQESTALVVAWPVATFLIL